MSLRYKLLADMVLLSQIEDKEKYHFQQVLTRFNRFEELVKSSSVLSS